MNGDTGIRSNSESPYSPVILLSPFSLHHPSRIAREREQAIEIEV
jgi:hypothetical protein